jgi:S-adenosylmethionine:tRNA ribosyltransferase-isomerase
MKTADFFFDLPEELIAQYPPPERGGSRLMLLDRKSGGRRHCMVSDLPGILAGPDFRGGDNKPPLLVFNNSRVRKARLKAYPANQGVLGSAVKETEFLLLNRIDLYTWKTMVKRAKRRHPESRYRFEGGLEGTIVETPASENGKAANEFRYIRFDSPIDDDWLDIHGHIPLPPYIKRGDEASDSERYQTIYAERTAGADLGQGASAASPTAGLHFSGGMLSALKEAGIENVFITLHVGLGTFLPVRTENIEDHKMHEEVYSIGASAAKKINDAKAAGRKIIAVGTTSVRTLESACIDAADGKGPYVKAGEGTTSIFLYPGCRFKVADALFTNFHTPCSTLLMLVSAFAGRELILESYAEAVRERYKFFSYGDAMLIW